MIMTKGEYFRARIIDQVLTKLLKQEVFIELRKELGIDHVFGLPK